MSRDIIVSHDDERHVLASGIHDVIFNHDLIPHVPVSTPVIRALQSAARDIRKCGVTTLTDMVFATLNDLFIQYAHLLERENAPKDERARCANAFHVLHQGYPGDTETNARWSDTRHTRMTPRGVCLSFCDEDNAVRATLMRLCETPHLLDLTGLSHTEARTARRLLGRLHDVYPRQHVTHQTDHYAVTPREFDILYRMLAVARTFALEPNRHAYTWLKAYPKALDACFKHWKREREHKTHDHYHKTRYAPFIVERETPPKGDKPWA